MKKIMDKFTLGQPKTMIRPVLSHFVDGIAISLPAIFVYFAINLLILYYKKPALIFDNGFWKICLGLFLLFILQFAVSILAYHGTYMPGSKNSTKNKKKFVGKIKKLPLGFFNKTESGAIINTFVSDFMAVEQSMVGPFTGIFGVVLSSVLTGVFIFLFNYKMAIAFYITMPICAIVINLSLKKFSDTSKDIIEAKDQTYNTLNEYLQGIQELKSYNQVGSNFEKIEKSYQDLMNISIKGEVISGVLLGFSTTLVKLGIPLMTLAGTYLLLGGKIQLVEFLSLIIIATRIISPLITWLRYMIILRNNYESAKRIDDYLHEEELFGKERVDAVDGIRFKNVDFSYDNKNLVLDGISFEIEKDTLTAIVGPSGGGKSTILRLIAKFWNTTGGEIGVSNHSLNNLEAEAWMNHISMVLQNVYLFNASIYENILFGKEDATRDEVMEASKLSGAHEFIEKLPEGYDTMVGEAGKSLSGGEKQRISIARAILKDAPILLLDEATSSLDAKNEVLVQRAISTLAKKRTVVMIAHKLKTIQNADRIIVLDQGRIMENGKHEDLLKKKGLYYKLWKIQNM